MPAGSNRCTWVSRLVGTKRAINTMAASTTGTLTMNTDPHQKCSSSQPPVTGPSATLSPAVAAQIAMAAARSRGRVNTLTSRASVAGKISAAPTPISARAPISWSASAAKAPSPLNSPNQAMPISNAPLRPKRSPRLPAASRRLANTRV